MIEVAVWVLALVWIAGILTAFWGLWRKGD